MLTAKQAADQLNVSVSLIYALCSAKRLRHERFGVKRGTIRIPADAIEEYRKKCTQGEASVPPAKEKVRLRHLRV